MQITASMLYYSGLFLKLQSGIPDNVGNSTIISIGQTPDMK